MKTKLVLIVFAVLWFVILCLPKQVKAQISDTCSCVPLTIRERIEDITGPRDTLIPVNLDSNLTVDTCGLEKNFQWENCGDIYEYIGKYSWSDFNRFYARGNWKITFLYKAIEAKSAPSGTIIIKRWYDIDSTKYPEVRNKFKFIEENVAPFTFTKINPTNGSEIDDENGDMGWLDQAFDLYFDNNKYVNMTNLGAIFKSTSMIRFSSPGITFYTSVIEKGHENNYSNKYYLNTESSLLIINLINDNYYQNKKIKIYNIYGNLIWDSIISINDFNNQGIQIDINNFSNGVYFLRIGNVCKKFIVNR